MAENLDNEADRTGRRPSLILGAVYLFIVKPVLDTTNNAFDSVNDTINNAFDDVGLDGIDIDDAPERQLQRHPAADIQTRTWTALEQQQRREAPRLRPARQPDTTKMQACAERFSP